jgi:hypothetical protein
MIEFYPWYGPGNKPVILKIGEIALWLCLLVDIICITILVYLNR